MGWLLQAFSHIRSFILSCCSYLSKIFFCSILNMLHIWVLRESIFGENICEARPTFSSAVHLQCIVQLLEGDAAYWTELQHPTLLKLSKPTHPHLTNGTPLPLWLALYQCQGLATNILRLITTGWHSPSSSSKSTYPKLINCINRGNTEAATNNSLLLIQVDMSKYYTSSSSSSCLLSKVVREGKYCIGKPLSAKPVVKWPNIWRSKHFSEKR